MNRADFTTVAYRCRHRCDHSVPQRAGDSLEGGDHCTVDRLPGAHVGQVDNEFGDVLHFAAGFLDGMWLPMFFCGAEVLRALPRRKIILPRATTA